MGGKEAKGACAEELGWAGWGRGRRAEPGKDWEEEEQPGAGSGPLKGVRGVQTERTKWSGGRKEERVFELVVPVTHHWTTALDLSLGWTPKMVFEGSLCRRLYFFFSCIAPERIIKLLSNFCLIISLNRCRGCQVWLIVTIVISNLKC